MNNNLIGLIHAVISGDAQALAELNDIFEENNLERYNLINGFTLDSFSKESKVNFYNLFTKNDVNILNIASFSVFFHPVSLIFSKYTELIYDPHKVNTSDIEIMSYYAELFKNLILQQPNTSFDEEFNKLYTDLWNFKLHEYRGIKSWIIFVK